MKKKLLISLIAACGMMFCSCHKNPAESFEGTYLVNSDVNYSNFGLGKDATGFDTQESGEITITLIGDDGQVQVTGMFNTTGHVDRDGVLHLDAEEHVGADLGADISVLGYSLLGVAFTSHLQHSAITLNDDGTMSWTASGQAAATVHVAILDVNVNANVTYSNTAVRQ